MNNHFCPRGTTPYVIKSGDTLYKLAADFSTSIANILQYNPHINSNNLIIGHILCIPTVPTYPPCPGENYHVVKSGDTLYKLSQMYNLPVEKIIKANLGINSNMLIIGQVVCIPIHLSKNVPINKD